MVPYAAVPCSPSAPTFTAYHHKTFLFVLWADMAVNSCSFLSLPSWTTYSVVVLRLFFVVERWFRRSRVMRVYRAATAILSSAGGMATGLHGVYNARITTPFVPVKPATGARTSLGKVALWNYYFYTMAGG